MKYIAHSLIVASLLCLQGCLSPNQKLQSAVVDNDTQGVVKVLSEGLCGLNAVNSALWTAVRGKNAIVAEALLQYLKTTNSLVTVTGYSDACVLEFDEAYTLQKGDNFRYYKIIKRPAPNLLSLAIMQHDEATARLLLDYGVRCDYEYYVDSSGAYPDNAEMIMADTNVVQIENRMNINGRVYKYLWKDHHLVTQNSPVTRKINKFYIIRTHSQAAREAGLYDIAGRIDTLNESRKRGSAINAPTPSSK